MWASARTVALAAVSPASDWHGLRPVHRVTFSDVLASPKRGAFFGNRTWCATDYIYAAFMLVVHAGCLLAPMTFSWNAFACFLATYFITGCIGITFSYHRQLSHKSFATPKWLEYAAAYCGALAVQGDPIVGVEPPVPPPVLRYAARPAHPVRRLLVVPHGVGAGQ